MQPRSAHASPREVNNVESRPLRLRRSPVIVDLGI
jgi:hypothetical protein